MKINADLTQRAVVNSNELEWVDSPLPGVQRRMLERDGEEVARATSLVRYEPGSYFDAYTHSGGEEFLVLDGIFSDEMGDFPKGMYVRNPIGSKHKPHTNDGTTILVKLQQFDPEDQKYVRIDTSSAEWQPGLVDEMSLIPLHQFKDEIVALVKWEPRSRFTGHGHAKGEEIFVLSGSFADELGMYEQGTWIRNPPGTKQCRYSKTGCILYVKTGHL